jgi:hypothetical protein
MVTAMTTVSIPIAISFGLYASLVWDGCCANKGKYRISKQSMNKF